MSRILALAPSGFGKTTGIAKVDDDTRKIHLEGLDPKTTYIISYTSKPLPSGNENYKVTDITNLKGGNRVIAKSAAQVVQALKELVVSPFINVILDDFNYIMQDWYMDNALKTGWDAPKTIGFNIGQIFKAMELYEGTTKNVIVLAHGEPVNGPDGRIYMKLKTTGKMVDEYVTPEGKFEVVLVGRSRWDSNEKRVIKEYITNENEDYSSPKSPIGMFTEMLITNDLGYVVKQVNKHYNKNGQQEV